MHGSRTGFVILALVTAAVLVGGIAGWQMRQRVVTAPVAAAPAPVAGKDILRATYDPIHFRPAIETARDAQCLACHREVLEDKLRDASPALRGACATGVRGGLT